MNFRKQFLLAVSTAILTVATFAQTTGPTKEINRMNQQKIMSLIPEVYTQAGQYDVLVDKESALLMRYVRSDQRNNRIGGEHFSIVVADDSKLKGFSNMSLGLVGKTLPTREQAESIARTFLQEYAPDLLESMEIHWIDKHDELIKVDREGPLETVTLTGMKVKMRNKNDGRWFWVIVGGNKKPLVFERDIVWITFPGKRQTEKWLHDEWLLKQQPDIQAVLLKQQLSVS